MHSLLHTRETLGTLRFRPNQIEVVLSDRFYTHPDQEIREQITQAWGSYYQERSSTRIIEDLNNYRLDGIERGGEGGFITLHLSRVKYSQKRGFGVLAKDHPELLTNSENCPRGIGIGGIIRTSDGKFIMISKRGGKTDAHNPLSIVSGIPTSEDAIQLKSGPQIAAYVAMEIKQEIGVPPECIQEVLLADLVFTDSGSVMIITETELSITAEEVLEGFGMHTDTDEITGIRILQSIEELEQALREIGGYHARMADLYIARLGREGEAPTDHPRLPIL
ncbi:hypothetical protein KC640_00140 [Candidatus Dojkabacteria bacterium]|uniref:Uncharacterized protein n=1 Tax=Candidatus Dojkabacteria bacterium TaxID=2099670 RepID=A0A955L036_9BACT|nr:hypothetical protein [Candidatus Dojkabacteria bacterium]